MMDDKVKIQAAINAIDDLEGMPIYHHMREAKTLLNDALYDQRLPSICTKCGVNEGIETIYNVNHKGFGFCFHCIKYERRRAEK